MLTSYIWRRLTRRKAEYFSLTNVLFCVSWQRRAGVSVHCGPHMCSSSPVHWGPRPQNLWVRVSLESIGLRGREDDDNMTGRYFNWALSLWSLDLCMVLVDLTPNFRTVPLRIIRPPGLSFLAGDNQFLSNFVLSVWLLIFNPALTLKPHSNIL